jgi:hypothetical protein
MEHKNLILDNLKLRDQVMKQSKKLGHQRNRLQHIEPRLSQQAMMLESTFCLSLGNEEGKKNVLGLYDSMHKDRVYHNLPQGVHEFIAIYGNAAETEKYLDSEKYLL